MLSILRKQHAVGQGFFHSSEIRAISPNPNGQYAFVYDCGTSSARSILDRAIDAHISELRKRRLNALFLSHIHGDHINGVKRLLASVRAEIIVIPKTSPLERLLLFVREGSTANAFEAEMAVDPVQALTSVSPRTTIVIIGHQDDRDQGPSGDGAPADLNGPVDSADNMPWKFSGRAIDLTGNRLASARVVEASDDGEFLIGSGQDIWSLIPYVQPGQTDDVRFRQVLGRRLGKSPEIISSMLDDRELVKELVTKHVEDLQAAYKSTKVNLNITSLMLYSGPTRQDANDATHAKARCAWLGTGDGRLSSRSALRPFLNHYRDVKSVVGTLSMPHHGSRKDSSRELYVKMMPRVAVAAVANPPVYGHPSFDAIQHAAFAGATVKLVTQNGMTAFREQVLYDKMAVWSGEAS